MVSPGRQGYFGSLGPVVPYRSKASVILVYGGTLSYYCTDWMDGKDAIWKALLAHGFIFEDQKLNTSEQGQKDSDRSGREDLE